MIIPLIMILNTVPTIKENKASTIRTGRKTINKTSEINLDIILFKHIIFYRIELVPA